MGSSSEKSSEVLDCINLEVFRLLLNEEFLLLEVFDLTLVKLDPLVLLVSSLLKRAGLAPDKSIPLTFTSSEMTTGSDNEKARKQFCLTLILTQFL